MRLDTIPFECRFAFLRRISRLSSQSNAQSLLHHVSNFVLAKQRLLECSAGTEPAFPSARCFDRDKAKDSGASKVHRSGGSWRAWLSRWLNTKTGEEKVNWKKAALEYKDLSMKGCAE